MADDFDYTLTEWLSRKLSLPEDDKATKAPGQETDDPEATLAHDTTTVHENRRDMGDLLSVLFNRSQAEGHGSDATPEGDQFSNRGEQADGDLCSGEKYADGNAGSGEAETRLADGSTVGDPRAEKRDQMMAKSPSEQESEHVYPEGRTVRRWNAKRTSDSTTACQQTADGGSVGSGDLNEAGFDSKGKKLTRRYSLWQRLQNIVRTKPKARTISATEDRRPASEAGRTAGDRASEEADGKDETDREHDDGAASGLAPANPDVGRPSTRACPRLDVGNDIHVGPTTPPPGGAEEHSRPQISAAYFDPLLTTPDASQTRRAKAYTTTSRWRKLRNNLREATTSASSDDVGGTTTNVDGRRRGAATLRVDVEPSTTARQHVEAADRRQRICREEQTTDRNSAEEAFPPPPRRGRSRSTGNIQIPEHLLPAPGDGKRKSFAEPIADGTAQRQDRSKGLLNRLLSRRSRMPTGGRRRSDSDPPLAA